MLAERAGHRVHVVEGEAANVKITTANDLDAARRATLSTSSGRIGTGYDLHRLVEGRPLLLGGVSVPSDKGAIGHSDADVVCHAVIDAMLGAACAGNVGQHYPDTDPRWKGASSMQMLRDSRQPGAGAWFRRRQRRRDRHPRATEDCAVHRSHSRRARRRARVAVDRVSVKGKTNEGVDAVGRGEAIAAHAVALLRCWPASPW